MKRYVLSWMLLGVAAMPATAQEVSYAKQVRPFLAKYCLECHNAKSHKAGLNLETPKAILEGSDRRAVLLPGKPDDSFLVTLSEGKKQPAMPPKAAKSHPKQEEVAVLRAWVKAGAKDDSAAIKVAIPDIKPTQPTLPPVRGLAYRTRGKGGAELMVVRGNQVFRTSSSGKMGDTSRSAEEVTACWS